MHAWACVEESFKDGSQDLDRAIDCAPCLKKRLNAHCDQKPAALDQGQVCSGILGHEPVGIVKNPEVSRRLSSEAMSPD